MEWIKCALIFLLFFAVFWIGFWCGYVKDKREASEMFGESIVYYEKSEKALTQATEILDKAEKEREEAEQIRHEALANLDEAQITLDEARRLCKGRSNNESGEPVL